MKGESHRIDLQKLEQFGNTLKNRNDKQQKDTNEKPAKKNTKKKQETSSFINKNFNHLNIK